MTCSVRGCHVRTDTVSVVVDDQAVAEACPLHAPMLGKVLSYAGEVLVDSRAAGWRLVIPLPAGSWRAQPLAQLLPPGVEAD